jgi:nitroreductase
MNEQIKKAVGVSQRAQRNYDLSKTIPDNDLETLIYAAANSPSKQNEIHFSLKVYTDQTIIKQIYNHTKRFALYDQSTALNETFREEDGKFWQNEDHSVCNSQILANALFVYVDDVGTAKGGEHMLAKQNVDGICNLVYQEQKNFSVGISVGELILSASLLGYKTGICSAFSLSQIQKIINTDEKIKLLVGVGYENTGIDRRLHSEVLNSEVPDRFRTGKLNNNWRFPSFNKTIKISINDN